MPTQLHLPTPPAGAQEINAVVAVVRERGDVAYSPRACPSSSTGRTIVWDSASRWRSW